MHPAYDELHMLIDGEKLSGNGRETSAVVNPATGEVIGQLPLASKTDLDAALHAAQRGFAVWRKMSAYERANILKRTASLIRERVDHIAMLMTLEQGKTLSESKAEVNGAADTFDWNAEEGRRAYGRVVPSRTLGNRWIVIREPIGPVAAFSPWNFPVNLPARKISSALAAGCSCIIKPAEETPASALALAKAATDAGVPRGVLNVVFGVPAEVSSYLIASPVIRKITFTGSTVVGKHLGRLAAEGVKRATMELGGHAPTIIFDDADIDKAIEQSVTTKFRNAGQVCTSPTRFYVQDAIHDRFVDRFAEATARLAVGDGTVASNQMGPCANARRLEAMESFVNDARKRGATVKLGGNRIGNVGFFWQPTVLSDVPNDATIMNTEPFGPIAAMTRFRRFDEVVEQANRLPYGLAAYAFTSSLKTATAISDSLETGLVGINGFGVATPEAPFGGVKESGDGSEGGIEGLESFTTTKFIAQMA